MTYAVDFARLKELLSAHGQSHLLAFWHELTPASQEQLARQILEIDWGLLDEWIAEYVLNRPEISLPDDLVPAPYRPITPRGATEQELYEHARAAGVELLKAGEVGAFTVAGGQGTRLGYDAPKGTYPISPLRGKSLFQLFAESLVRAQDKFDATIPWYILTSPVNDADTRAFFEEHDYFGLDAQAVMFLPQGTLPAVGLNGKLLLAAKDSLALSPNGHGGSLLALRCSGALDDMKARSIQHISYWQVDNPLVYPLDPLFIGLHSMTGSQMSCRSLTKTGPFEKLGNFCMSNGKVMIIEYSDMPEEMATATEAEGALRFRAGSPAIHVLNRQFVEKLTAGGTLRLNVHRADKKVSCIDENGTLIEPDAPNAVKLEMFIFDALPLADNVLILEAEREEQFGPVKNAHGVDSPDSCKQLLIERAARWLEQAGIAVPRTDTGAADAVIELSTRRYLDVADVMENKTCIAPPSRGGKEYYQ